MNVEPKVNYEQAKPRDLYKRVMNVAEILNKLTTNTRSNRHVSETKPSKTQN